MTAIDNNLYKYLLEILYDGVYFVDCTGKILYWNKGAEKITGYMSSEVVGKRCVDTVLNHVDKCGIKLYTTACPLFETIMDYRPREIEVYIQHKKGYRIPVFVRTTPLLDSDEHIIGAVEIFSDNTPKLLINQRIQDLERMALLDPLTELANRRYIEMNIQSKLDELYRYGRSFGLFFMDIDHFKKINDVYGHDVGDKVLKMVTKTILNSVRTSDIVGRWGGEEFIAITPNVDKERLHFISNKLHALIEYSSFSIGSDTIQVTISIGATIAQPNDTVSTLLERSDKLMYYSKVSGRNRTSIG